MIQLASWQMRLLTMVVATCVSQVCVNQVLAQNLTLDEIVVTAQKKVESLQDVPIAVTAIDQRSLDNFKFRNTQEIASQAPNVQMLGSNGDAQLVLGMRGVTQSDYSPNGTGAVALYVDEVYMGATPLSSGVQLFDIERVEMLLGPQGTLYGKNATGGAVNIITAKPKMNGNSGHIDVGFGNYGLYSVSGAFDSELSDHWGVRLAFTQTENDGLVDNKLSGVDDQGQIAEGAVRLSVRYERDDVNAILRLHSSRTRAKHSGILLKELSAQGLGATGYTRAGNGLDFHESQSNRVDDKEFDLTGANLTVNYNIGSYTLTSITSFDDAEYFVPEDADGSPWRLLEDDFFAQTDQVTQDLRLTSDLEGNFNFILGLYYSADDTDGETRFRWMADGGNGTVPTERICDSAIFEGCYYANKYEQTRDSKAAYLYTTYRLTDSLTLTAGLRYTDDAIEIDDYRSWYGQARNSFGIDVDGPPIPGNEALFINGLDDSRDDTDTSGKIGLDYSISEDVMIYGAYSTGYRGSAFNGFAFIIDEFSAVKPEELEAWELGFKSRLQAGRIRLNGAIFRYTYENQQFLFFDAGLQTLLNAGESEITGAEIQLTTQATEQLRVALGAGYLDAEYTELNLGGDLSGNELPSSPKSNINLALDYDIWGGDVGAVQFHYDANYIAKQYFEPFNEDRLAQEGYTVQNARLSFQSADEVHSLSLYIKNLADKEYAVYSVNLEATWNGLYFFRGAPRTFGAEYKFQF